MVLSEIRSQWNKLKQKYLPRYFVKPVFQHFLTAAHTLRGLLAWTKYSFKSPIYRPWAREVKHNPFPPGRLNKLTKKQQNKVAFTRVSI